MDADPDVVPDPAIIVIDWPTQDANKKLIF
jgi:hypothetical protein